MVYPSIRPFVHPYLVALLLVAFSPLAAAAQVFETVGGRALGMGGAFVAVADDASGVHWNPAALALGQPAGGLVEWNRFGNGDGDDAPGAGAWQRSARFMSFGTWPLGVSYTRIDDRHLTSGAAATRAVTRSFGLSLLQSLSNSLVVGSTLRYVRGTISHSPIAEETIDDAFDALGEIRGKTSGAFDLDLSAVFNAGVFRLGGTIRNLRAPAFEDVDGREIRPVQRRSRIGLAVLPTAGLTLAMDLDVDTADELAGPRRMLAAGAEQRVTPRVMVRAGARRNLAGDKALVGTAGASLALRPGTWLDGHVTIGRSSGERGAGLSLRAGW